MEIGNERAVAGEDTTATIRLRDYESLRGHLGLIEIIVDGRLLGEVEVQPDKLSHPQYELLRAELESAWSGLVFDTRSPSSVQARLPSATELVRRIERPLHSILEMPRESIEAGTRPKHLRNARRASELTVSVVRRAAQGRPGLARTPCRSVETAENAMVVATIRKLALYARRSGEPDTAARLTRLLHSSPLRGISRRPKAVTWGMRSDPAYRQVLEVHRLLDRPELGATEGPGELRLGVRGMVRLYEYWVYLQVLMAAEERYGKPLEPGFAVLGRQLAGGRARLELPAGTTITFPGPVHVAFDPTITPRGDGWGAIEYVPHPDAAQAKAFATPDVVVFHPGSPSWLVVIDAKYVARSWVERAAAEIHGKYARMRFEGRPVVRYVLAAHPQRGLESRWAGYGSVPMVPGDQLPPLPLPRLTTTRPNASETPGGTSRVAVVPAGEPVLPSGVVVIADQGWMHQHLGDRRVDLRSLEALAIGERARAASYLVLPPISLLEPFARAAEARGWMICTAPDAQRKSMIKAIVDLVADLGESHIAVVVTGDEDVVAALEARRLHAEIIDDLSLLPDL